jgi:hypothetical protein
MGGGGGFSRISSNIPSIPHTNISLPYNTITMTRDTISSWKCCRGGWDLDLERG